MSSKQSENKVCQECESEFKIIYDLDKTSGYTKMCPFCGSELYGDEEEDEPFDE